MAARRMVASPCGRPPGTWPHPRPASQRRPVRVARRGQRHGRRDGRPGAGDRPAARGRGVRSHHGDRGAGVPGRIRPDQGGHQPRRRGAGRSDRTQARAGRRLAGGCPGPIHPDPGARLGLGGGRQRPARGQPGPDLVDDRPDEDRPGRSAPSRLRAGAQRGGGLRGRRGRRVPDGLDRGIGRTASGAVLRRDRDRRSGVGRLRAVRARDPRPRGEREWRGDRPGRRGSALAPARVAEHHRRPVAVGRLAGRAGQQPERRARLGTPADRLGRGIVWTWARSGCWRPPIRPPGGSPRSPPGDCPIEWVASA